MTFSAKVEDQALARAEGQCEECGGQLKPGKFHFHHRTPRWKGGGDTLENAKVLCVRCHLAQELDHDSASRQKADRKAKIKAKLPVARGEPEIARRFRKEE
jgi:5-methylcytosine-specific restriction endonuclease McrA